eukprot:CAMPEP_0116889570 /NCGR_PEP_ID=MMETSP0467-20121206/106_1 /TAXON_ID=283647 /ORGANISM="Mesodinium pulex, Strain SPMC105" /LENGTH=68 /DNA_ID=CAMNT_0004556457 /DNA_START=764 /DNA_END=970 /DNA_ORIENTATION=-
MNVKDTSTVHVQQLDDENLTSELKKLEKSDNMEQIKKSKSKLTNINDLKKLAKNPDKQKEITTLEKTN